MDVGNLDGYYVWGENIYITIWMCGIWMDILCGEEHIHNNMDVWNMDGYYV
jgi:hypothetical protein